MRETSKIAYRELQPKLNALEQDVLIQLHIHPDVTDKELAQAAGKTFANDIDNFRKRRADLAAKGLVVCSGKRVCSVTKKLCCVWRLKYP
ncbi:MAG: hypothetical protein WC325_11355 [Candidatus Bathyarchaeia archaeon]|jgi:hypothetical protein